MILDKHLKIRKKNSNGLNKLIVILFFVLGSLPMIAYPFAMIANLLQNDSGMVSPFMEFVKIYTTVYPIVLFICVTLYKRYKYVLISMVPFFFYTVPIIYLIFRYS